MLVDGWYQISRFSFREQSWWQQTASLLYLKEEEGNRDENRDEAISMMENIYVSDLRCHNQARPNQKYQHRQGLVGLKEGNDSSSNIRICSLSTCLMFELTCFFTSAGPRPAGEIPCQEGVMEAGEQVHMFHLSTPEQARNFISPFKTSVPV